MTSRVRVSILALAFAVFVAVPTIATAQTEVGVKAGVNLANLSFEGDDEDDVKSLTGLTAGLYLAKNLQNNLGLRVEGLFSQKGAKEGDDFKFKMVDIDFPVLFVFSPTSSSDTTFNFFAGPQVSLNTSATIEFDGDSEDADNVKGSNFAAVVGVGLKKGKISADVRYVLGLSSIADEGDSVKHKVLSVMVGWQLK